MSRSFSLEIHACKAGAIYPVIPPYMRNCFIGHIASVDSGFFALNMASATQLVEINSGKPCFTLQFKSWLTTGVANEIAILAPFLKAAIDFPVNTVLEVGINNRVLAGAIITLSDKGAEGLRQDRAGPALQEILEEKLPDIRIARYILPDEKDRLKTLLTDLALCQQLSLIVTTGGTGVSPRDITPQATRDIIDYEMPGFAWLMMRESCSKTPNAAVSRAVCGVLGKCLIINVPGSVRGATENLQAVLPALDHTLAKLGGDMEDCGG